MNKSVYSLVLMDNVVSEVDKMAYEMGTSRSNLINQILAEYVRYTTPEMRMRAVFEEKYPQIPVLVQQTASRSSRSPPTRC